MTKIKLYKNPERKNPATYKPYVPAYEVHGLPPIEISPASVTEEQAKLSKHAPVVSRNNPRTRPAPGFRKTMPFALPTKESPVGKGPLPNTGNNVETTWVSVDGDDFDDVIYDEENSQLHKAVLDPNHTMIDNNQDDYNNYQDIPEELPGPPEKQPTYRVSAVEEKESEALSIGDEDYVLIVSGNILAVGSQDVVQEQVKLLVFGEHPINQTNDISSDDIIVLKRVKIKVGVFLE